MHLQTELLIPITPSLNTSARIVTDYGLDDWESNRGWGTDFAFCQRIHTESGINRAPHSVVPGALSSGIKQPGPEADHLPPVSADVKNAWSFNSVDMASCLIK
jgi:hypothetical protein